MPVATVERFQVVESPSLWPTKCMLCNAQKGPMLDTMTEYPAPGGIGRVYLCMECLRTATRIVGWTSGKKLNELKAAADELSASKKELDYRSDEINELIKRVEEQRKTILAQEHVIEEKEGQIKQAKHLSSLAEGQFGQLAEAVKRM